MTGLKEHFKAIKLEEFRREADRIKEEKNRLMKEQKAAHVHVTGVKRDFKRSKKPLIQRHEVKKEVLSEDQVDIQRYLGMQLDNDAQEQRPP